MTISKMKIKINAIFCTFPDKLDQVPTLMCFLASKMWLVVAVSFKKESFSKKLDGKRYNRQIWGKVE